MFEVFTRGELVGGYELAEAFGRPDLEALVRLAAQVCAVPSAVINIVDDHWQRPLASVGMQAAVCAREDSMCAVTVVAPEPVYVPDARLDPRFAANPFVTGEVALVRFYAASQLRTPTGRVLGTLCVFDDVPRTLAASQTTALDDLARQVIDLLELRRRTRVLGEALLELDETRSELVRSNEELAAFAGQVAHDLSSPMLGVRHLVELLSARPAVTGDATAVLLVERVLGGVGRMTDLLDDLLAYAGLGGGVQRTPVDLADVLAEVLEDLHVELAGAAVTAAGLPVFSADRTQVRALLQNLLSNSARFRHPDRPLEIRVEARPEADGYRVTVVDNGRGVPPHLREEAFELLTQVHDPGLKAGGSGIGLATCRRIVGAHGGAIGIDDGTDGGAAVWFTLPGS